MLLLKKNDKLYHSMVYGLKYILMVIIFWLASAFLGVPCLYSIPLAVPFLTYLVLVWSIIRSLENDTKVKKEDIVLPVLIIATIFNILFFYFVRQFDFLTIMYIVVTTIIELLLLKPRKKR